MEINFQQFKFFKIFLFWGMSQSKPQVFYGTTHFLPREKKWVTKLFGYDYEIIYKKGKDNVVADAVS
jgi:hypothetical protein